jgi:hypothetical protein
MLAALTGLGGLLGSFAGPIFTWLQKKQELEAQQIQNSHELAMLQATAALQAQAQSAKLEEVRVRGLVQEQIAELAPGAGTDTAMALSGTTGIRAVDALDFLLTTLMNAYISSVRPTVTYVNNAAFWALVFLDADNTLGLGIFAKATGVRIDMTAWQSLMGSVLIEAVVAAYSSVNGFWFGSRMLQRLGIGKKS